MSDYIAAHASVAAAIKAAAPLPTAHAEICQLVAEHVKIDPADGTVTILEGDGSVALDRDAGFIPMTPAGFVASLKTTRPWLFSEVAKPVRASALAPAVSSQPATVTEMMAAARRGDTTAKAALEAALNAKMKL